MEENLDEFDYMIINVESCLNGSINNLNKSVSISDCDSADSIVEIMIENKGKIGKGEVGGLEPTALKGVIGNIPDGRNYVDVYARYYSDIFVILFGCDRFRKNIAINFINRIGNNYAASGWLTIIKDSWFYILFARSTLHTITSPSEISVTK